jgi:Ras family.
MEEGLKFAKENGMQFFETSAKSGSNIEDVQ